MPKLNMRWIAHKIPTLIHVRIIQLKIIIKQRNSCAPSCPSWCRFCPMRSVRMPPGKNYIQRTLHPGWTGLESRRSLLEWHNSSLQDSTNRSNNRNHIFGSSRDCPQPCSTIPLSLSRKFHSIPRKPPLPIPSSLIPCT